MDLFLIFLLIITILLSSTNNRGVLVVNGRGVERREGGGGRGREEGRGRREGVGERGGVKNKRIKREENCEKVGESYKLLFNGQHLKFPQFPEPAFKDSICFGEKHSHHHHNNDHHKNHNVHHTNHNHTNHHNHHNHKTCCSHDMERLMEDKLATNFTHFISTFTHSFTHSIPKRITAWKVYLGNLLKDMKTKTSNILINEVKLSHTHSLDLLTNQLEQAFLDPKANSNSIFNQFSDDLFSQAYIQLIHGQINMKGWNTELRACIAGTKMINDLFLSTVTFKPSLSQGILLYQSFLSAHQAVNYSSHFLFDAQCSRLLLQMSGCPLCLNTPHPPFPCINYCLHVTSHCFQPILSFQHVWVTFIGALIKLPAFMKPNFELPFKILPLKVFEAVVNMMLNAETVFAVVNERCHNHSYPNTPHVDFSKLASEAKRLEGKKETLFDRSLFLNDDYVNNVDDDYDDGDYGDEYDDYKDYFKNNGDEEKDDGGDADGDDGGDADGDDAGDGGGDDDGSINLMNSYYGYDEDDMSLMSKDDYYDDYSGDEDEDVVRYNKNKKHQEQQHQQNQQKNQQQYQKHQQQQHHQQKQKQDINDNNIYNKMYNDKSNENKNPNNNNPNNLNNHNPNNLNINLNNNYPNNNNHKNLNRNKNNNKIYKNKNFNIFDKDNYYDDLEHFLLGFQNWVWLDVPPAVCLNISKNIYNDDDDDVYGDGGVGGGNIKIKRSYDGDGGRGDGGDGGRGDGDDIFTIRENEQRNFKIKFQNLQHLKKIKVGTKRISNKKNNNKNNVNKNNYESPPNHIHAPMETFEFNINTYRPYFLDAPNCWNGSHFGNYSSILPPTPSQDKQMVAIRDTLTNLTTKIFMKIMSPAPYRPEFDSDYDFSSFGANYHPDDDDDSRVRLDDDDEYSDYKSESSGDDDYGSGFEYYYNPHYEYPKYDENSTSVVYDPRPTTKTPPLILPSLPPKHDVKRTTTTTTPSSSPTSIHLTALFKYICMLASLLNFSFISSKFYLSI